MRLRFEVNASSDIFFYENVVLIEADSPKEAFKKAEVFGRAQEEVGDDFVKDGVKASYLYAGIRKLINISNPPDKDLDVSPPVSGTEVTYYYFRAPNEIEFQKYLSEEEAQLFYRE